MSAAASTADRAGPGALGTSGAEPGLAGAAVAPGALRRTLRRVERRKTLRGLALVLPLLLFLLVFFVWPIAGMLRLAVANPELREVMPRSAEALRDLEPGALPDEATLAIFAEELRVAYEERTLASVAKRLNTEMTGLRSLVMGTGRGIEESPSEGTWRATFEAIDEEWTDPAVWAVISRAAEPWTDLYLLSAVDLERDASQEVVAVADDRAIYRDILLRTFQISLTVTIACLVLGYPLAYRLATLPNGLANLLMILVLLPFWTSLLVRTASWIVILQREGPVNQILQWIGLIAAPLELVYNRTGVIIAMTHVLLPFMVLPLYSVMRGIPASYTRAALSLGARPFTAFRKIYLPLSMPGIGAGCLLVFIISIGYYITPALVGGASDQMISYFIAFFTLQTINWGMAAALGSVLLLAVLLLYLLYARLVGIDRLRIS